MYPEVDVPRIIWVSFKVTAKYSIKSTTGLNQCTKGPRGEKGVSKEARDTGTKRILKGQSFEAREKARSKVRPSVGTQPKYLGLTSKKYFVNSEQTS